MCGIVGIVRREGRRVDAVAQITKTGHVYVFERTTGRPLFPIEYRRAGRVSGLRPRRPDR